MQSLGIALTIDNSKPLREVFFSNGISQNIKFLYDLLELLGHRPYLMGLKPETGRQVEFGGKQYRLLSVEEMFRDKPPTAMVLEIGVCVSPDDRAYVRREMNSRIITVRYGHTLFMDMEQICYKETLAPGTYVKKPEMVWASPHFEVSLSYLETLNKAPVAIAPFIWEPDFTGAPFDATAYRAVPDLYVMEPNISLLKNALIPMAIVERAFEENPDQFGKAVVLNSHNFHQQTYFVRNIVQNMESLSSKYQKVFFADRTTFANVFKQRDVLIGHQYGCELNYLYLEALYKNIPLVHNSPALQDAGYFYPDFRVNLGVEALHRAIEDRDIAGYRERSARLLEQFSIHNPAVQQAYRDLIGRTMAIPVRQDVE